MDDLAADIQSIAAETGFSGVVRIDDADGVVFASAHGLAQRGHEIRNTLETQFGIASGAKSLTALAVVALIEDGLLDLATPVRAVLGPDLPLIDDRVTVEQLLSHRSGIGDYVDEDDEIDLGGYLLRVPVHELATTEDYLAVLDGYEMKFAPGERFSYCNSGYVVLALIAERAGKTSFYDLVNERVCARAGLTATAFLRSDELPHAAATGYLQVDGVWRTNVFHLPVRGSGDGGVYTTVTDVHALWEAFVAGRIVSSGWVAEMLRPRSDVSSNAMRYGLGFWLHASSEIVVMEGSDAGVSFRSGHDPAAHTTWTVISNTTDGAWPVARRLAGHFEDYPTER